MKTWDMLRELSENPLLKFKDNSGSVVGISDKTGRVVWLNGDREDAFVIHSYAYGFVDNLHLDWELVPQEVTWQEAISAWLDGEAVACKYKGSEITFLSGGINMALYVDKEKLKYGKWYIKS